MIEKVISGGQTGADRTGLEVARNFGIPTGGHCPKDFRTDTGFDPSLKEFNLEETISSSYVPRTILNAQNSDGTVWFGSEVSPGFFCTRRGVLEKKRNLRLLCKNPTIDELVAWIKRYNIKVLNVAGNRQSTNPGVVKLVRDTLTEAFNRLNTVIAPEDQDPVRAVFRGGGCE